MAARSCALTPSCGPGSLSYGNRATKKFAKGDERHLPPEVRSKVKELLRCLKRSDSPADPRAADYQIHRLTGDRKDDHAIAISDRRRVVFRFKDSNTCDVEVVAHR